MVDRCLSKPLRRTRHSGGLLFIVLVHSTLFVFCSCSSIPEHRRSSQICASSEFSSHEKCSKKVDDASHLKSGFSMLDADFFNDSKMLEIEKGAKELNIPVYKANRKIVATTNGGLKYPSPLVFNSEWKHEEPHDDAKRFNYPSVFGVTRPENDEDIAFMTILELGHLIQTEQITSEELVGIFLKRLKRYNPVLEAVITITEDLAYKQAKQADQLLAQGVYLGPLHGIPYGLKDIIAVPEYKTTWGSSTFKDQVLDIEAWVYKRYGPETVPCVW